MKSSLINLNLSLFSNEAHNQRPGCATELIAVVQLLSRVQLFATPWTVAHQAPLSIEFSMQEYWSGLPFPSPGDLCGSGIEPVSPALQADSLLSEPLGKPPFELM